MVDTKMISSIKSEFRQLHINQVNIDFFISIVLEEPVFAKGNVKLGFISHIFPSRLSSSLHVDVQIISLIMLFIWLPRIMSISKYETWDYTVCMHLLYLIRIGS